MANLLHLKASRTKVLNSLPTKNLGNDGDIVISRIKGRGVYLCTKALGTWHVTSKLSEISKIDKTPLDIIAKKLKIKDIKKSSESNKFVVSEKNGELRYQNSEEVIETLNLENLSLNYKTAYCSLGQYTNKEECEANNGTWYYSENESHDSISSTAENQLLTVGQSIGTLDSEPTLLYDGSTLEIKRNTDYDDNWQTSAQDALLKLSYDSTNNTTVGISSGGDLTITPSGGDTTLSSSTLTIGTIAEVGSDTDKILMSDSGVVKYVTGANLRSYIGAGTSSFGGALNDLSDVTYSSGDLTISSLDKIISGALEFEPTGTITIDRNTSGDGAEDATALHIDYDRTIATSGTNAHNDAGIDLDMNVGSLGTSNFRGIDIDLVGTNDGVSILRGIDINVSGGDKNYGLDITSSNSQIFLRHTTDPDNDYARVTLSDTGDLEIKTIGSGTNDSDLTLNIDGDIILDPSSQKVIINATDGLYFDGGNDTYIYEQSADILRIVVGADILMNITETGDDGNNVYFPTSCVTFNQLEPTYNGTTTNVDFRHSNKQFVTFGSGNITNLSLYFPSNSGNFVLLLKQDGTGSRTVTNWKVFENDESAADGDAGVKFAGGSAPTLTTAANHVDIISFYWDGDNEIAYGVATLDFQD